MLEKFLKLTPKLSKIFPIFDTSGETMCNNNITNRDRPNFLNLQTTKFQAFTIFSVPKITSTKTPETRKPLFLQQESQKIQFCDIFSVKFYDDETSFSSQNYSQVKISYQSKGLLFDQMNQSFSFFELLSVFNFRLSF